MNAGDAVMVSFCAQYRLHAVITEIVQGGAMVRMLFPRSHHWAGPWFRYEWMIEGPAPLPAGVVAPC